MAHLILIHTRLYFFLTLYKYRAKLSSEQADRLMAGTNAARILDMLLTFSSQEERFACLPDCFTPPPEASAMSSGGDDSISTEEVWCTPSQMLSEIEARIRLLTCGQLKDPYAPPNSLLSSGQNQTLSGPALMSALEGLREGIKLTWLEGIQRLTFLSTDKS